MYVKIPGRGSNRINASYAKGGASLLEKTLEQNFGVTVDAHVGGGNFDRLVNVIDAIGGVEVEVSEAERVQVNSILRFYNTKIGADERDQLLNESGVQLLTGKQALCFSRIRKIDNDFKRSSRQRQVIEAAFHKVMNLDMISLSALIIQNMDAVETDLGLSDALELIPMAMVAKNANLRVADDSRGGRLQQSYHRWYGGAGAEPEEECYRPFRNFSESKRKLERRSARNGSRPSFCA